MSDVTPSEEPQPETAPVDSDSSAATEPTPETAAETRDAPVAAAASPAASAAAPATSAAGAPRPNRRKVREGLVSSSVMDKTVVVNVIERVRHPRYAKTVQRTKHFYAHDEGNEVRVGDRVRIQETRPMSRLKRWRVVEVLERAR